MTLGTISDKDKRLCHFLKSTCDIGDPQSMAPVVILEWQQLSSTGDRTHAVRQYRFSYLQAYNTTWGIKACIPLGVFVGCVWQEDATDLRAVLAVLTIETEFLPIWFRGENYITVEWFSRGILPLDICPLVFCPLVSCPPDFCPPVFCPIGLLPPRSFAPKVFSPKEVCPLGHLPPALCKTYAILP